MSHRFYPHLVCVGVLACGAAALGACVPQKPTKAAASTGQAESNAAASTAGSADDTVAVINAESMSLAAFDRRIDRLPAYARARYGAIDQQQSYLDSVVQFEVMADVAERRGLGSQRSVFFAMKQAMADEVVARELAAGATAAKIDSAAVEAYYDAHRDQYRVERARRVALIKLDSREQAAAIRRRVVVEMDAAKDSPTHAFRRLAAAYSVDPAAAKTGGDIGFVDAPDGGAANDDDASHGDSGGPAAPIARAVFELDEAGQVTPVFGVDDGWAMATFFDTRAAKVESVDQAGADIRKKLAAKRRRRRRADLVDALRREADVDIDADAVAAVDKPAATAGSSLADIALHPAPAADIKAGGGERRAASADADADTDTDTP